MAQDPDREDEQPGEGAVDASEELDMVTLFSSSNIDSELEANSIHNVLQANGIPSVVVGASMIPSLEFQVQVPRVNLDEARRLLAEARETGPDAAAEAEAASEEGQ
jgi:hypothetical protein